MSLAPVPTAPMGPGGSQVRQVLCALVWDIPTADLPAAAEGAVSIWRPPRLALDNCSQEYLYQSVALSFGDRTRQLTNL
jgi:hypothetical protein